MGYDQELGALRHKINEIDEKLVALFVERMYTTDQVANVKQKYGKKVFDEKREEAVIARALSLLKEQGYGEDVRSFFQAVMDISKNSQKKIVPLPEGEVCRIENTAGVGIGYLGIRGSFSHIAAEDVFGSQAALKNYDTFEAIFDAMKFDDIGYAIVPAENTETGSITTVVDLLARYGYYIVAEKLLKVSHSLLGVRGATLSDIKRIYSHPEPLAQCRAFLNAHPDIETYPSLSTAQAAITVSELNDKSVGCIASEQAGKIYGLDVIQQNIQNNDNNCTRFVVIAKKPCQDETCNKTSIVFMVEHRPGSLCEILNLFYHGGVNILKLESRPLKDRPFEYMFHLDFEGSIADSGVKETIERVKKTAANFIYLGCYKRQPLSEGIS